jgi:hypothetical protein
LFYCLENFGGVALGWRLVPDFGYAAVGADQKRGAHDSQKRLAEELLHASRAISFNGLEFRIAQEREIQIIFGGEFALSLHFIATAAEDDGAELVKFWFGVAKLGRFVNSTRGKRLREKI